MSKKKKQSGQAQQKVAKAQHKNDYMRRLERILTLIHPDVSLFNMMEASDRMVLYEFRSASPKVVVAEGSKAPRDMIDRVEMVFKSMTISMEMELIEGSGRFVSMSDFWNFCFQIELLLKDDVRGKEYYADFLADRTRARRFAEKALLINTVMGMYCCDIGKVLYHINCDFTAPNPDQGDFRRRVILEIHSFEPEKKHITVDGVPRTVVRMAWMNANKPLYLWIKAGMVERNCLLPELKIPVYIQQHAIDRLEERTLTRWKGILFMEAANAILDANVIRNSKGDLLIAFTIWGMKVGYFFAELIDGILLVRTFLFMTNSGTPEGEKLEQLTGLQKADKEYLNIDRMEALVLSDILENNEVCDIFRKAGCQSLLDACKAVQGSDEFNMPSDKQAALASRITDYLKREEENSDMPDVSEEV